MNITDPSRRAAMLAGGLLLSSFAAQSEQVRITIENLAPADGVFFTPVWLGFHDGSFDIYDSGQAASAELEAVAEDGDNGPLSAAFQSAVPTGLDTVVTDAPGFAGAPVFDPGSRSSITVDLDPASQRFMSYASMLLPSNDAFFANGDPRAVELFDADGNFAGPISFLVRGNRILDAGTEDNTESDAAFFNQSAPNTGVTSGGVIGPHPGFNGSLANPDGSPVVFLGGTSGPGIFFDATAADFTAPNYQVARITIAPATLPVSVSITNVQDDNGLFLTPVWAGFHDGSFDLYDIGAPASPGLERVAEDGDTGEISAEFQSLVTGGIDATITEPEGFAGAPLFEPGANAVAQFDLDPVANRYFSFASMVIPSNDAFIGNGNPTAWELFDDSGNFTGPVSFIVSGDGVRDAGTEVNNETDAAFLDQAAADAGTVEGGTVQVHPGLNGSEGNPDATPVNILGAVNGPGFSFEPMASDFTRNSFRVARITLSRAVDGSYSGSWFNTGRSGEGLLLELVDDANPTAVVSFYTYAPDGSGDQVWLFGSGPLVGDTAIADLVITEGAQFGDGFDAASVTRTDWGQVRVQFTSPTTAVLEYESLLEDYGSGTMNLNRLTQPLVGASR
ncbi:MAG: spondin domain-containing protein [Xanthomonadales bacterium]|nr:spondin domain-containing protein [Xanthomonadales bacterium]